jgi:NAD(P)-dependent dehydrogenase (short-subunit alcohol dehydrogenase family)
MYGFDIRVVLDVHLLLRFAHSIQSIHIIIKDVSNQSSIQSAASLLSTSLGTSKLYAIVNNAGTGFSHGTSPAEILDTNTRGPKRVVDAFLPLLEPKGRIVNVGSGAGPMFFDMLETSEKKKYVEPMEEGEIEKEISRIEDMNEGFVAYAGSKALLACYTLDLAKKNPDLMVSIITPGELAVQILSMVYCIYPATLNFEMHS